MRSWGNMKPLASSLIEAAMTSKQAMPRQTWSVSQARQRPRNRSNRRLASCKQHLPTNCLKVRSCSPKFFEELVVELLVAMGYGGSLTDAGKAIGKSGDGGIDGIIKEDKLGLDVVCIQAKRWSNTVGRPEVQAFAGSMEGFRARKGVLLTTSKFSSEALDYVGRIERKIVLIDGRQLAQLMMSTTFTFIACGHCPSWAANITSIRSMTYDRYARTVMQSFTTEGGLRSIEEAWQLLTQKSHAKRGMAETERSAQ